MNKIEYPYHMIGFEDVKLTDDFWKPIVDRCINTTIPHVLRKCEKSRRLENFKIAGGLSKERRSSKLPFDDSDVYKTLEGIAYSLILKPDSRLANKLDEIIEMISSAQEGDGYLYTFRTMSPDNPHFLSGKHRWEEVSIFSHELYNVGHLYEAAVAHFFSTGKKSFLKIALQNAELIEGTFGYGKLERPPGHQEIELGLARLYEATGNRKYMDLAKFFLDIRGDTTRKGYSEYVSQSENKLPWLDSERFKYNQTHQLVINQEEAVGHAVRATYMYSAMADIGVFFNDEKYITALDLIWEDVVSHKISLTGGIGAKANGEAFDEAYILPNFYDRGNELGVYNETCASIGNIFWNYRLFRIHGNAKYFDVLERTLYNGLLSGMSFEGDKFFYPNPLASTGDQFRRSWFECACCPSNLVRFLPQVQNYIYTLREQTFYVNLFIGSETKVKIDGVNVEIHQRNDYPWDGLIEIEINPEKIIQFTIAIRIPGWSQERPIPSDLYNYMKSEEKGAIEGKINGGSIDVEIDDKGYFKIAQNWEKGDKIQLRFPMQIYRVISNPKVKDNVGKVALERGPLVYCFESIDNSSIHKIRIDDKDKFISEFSEKLINRVHIVRVTSESETDHEQELIAIPYYAWANRGKSEMTVWVNH
jgi:DUF1680 family protein